MLFCTFIIEVIPMPSCPLIQSDQRYLQSRTRQFLPFSVTIYISYSVTHTPIQPERLCVLVSSVDVLGGHNKHISCDSRS